MYHYYDPYLNGVNTDHKKLRILIGVDVVDVDDEYDNP